MIVALPAEDPWLDKEAGPLVRPYTLTNGRTHPTTALELLSMVRATGRAAPGRLGPEHSQALGLCHIPTSVAEVAARLHQPVMITKVLVSDLIDCGVVTTRAPDSISDFTDRQKLEKVLVALRRL